MADSRTIITAVSVAVAIAAAGWGLYVTLHAGRAEQMSSAEPRSPAESGRSTPGSALASEPPRTAANIAVAVITAVVQKEKLATELNALGTARANEAVEVTSKTSNIVTAVHFSDGQRVRQGQVLVELDSAQARADVAEAEAARADSASQVKRSKELLATRVLSEAQYEQLEATLKANEARLAAARARLADTVIRAPFSGRVGLRRVSVGSLVNPGTVITTLDDISVIKVDFAVPENFIAGLRQGLKVTATAAAFPGREFSGTVTGVDSRVDPVSRSVIVRAEIANPSGELKPGMFLNVRLTRDEHDALMIPEGALVPEQSRQFVFVVEDGQALRREVRIGRREPGRVEIVAGLEPGERVVVEGTQKLREGSLVREAAPRFTPGRPDTGS
jgi:membrane fusion protein (multidrug efflux system)